MKIGIIGAGIKGLACAYKLLRKGHEVILIEKDKDFGGLSGSFLLGGNFLEKYMQYISEDDRDISELIDELSISSELLWFKPKRGAFYKNYVNPFDSTGNLLSFRSINIIDRMRFPITMARMRGISDWKSLEDITAENWLRGIGGGSLFRTIWTPLLKKKFDTFYNEISAVYLWARYRDIGKKVAYLRGGFQRLIEILGQEINMKGMIKNSTLAKSISSLSDGKVKVVTEKGPMTFDALVVTAPFQHFINMCKDLPLEYNMNASSLNYISKVSLVLELSNPFGITYLTEFCDSSVPFSEIIEHTNLISPENYNGSHIIYILNYVNQKSVYMNYSPQKLLDDYIPFLKMINPSFQQEWIKKSYLFRANYAYPVTTVNYSKKVPDILSPLHRVFLATEAQIYPEERGLNSSISLVNRVVEQISALKENVK